MACNYQGHTTGGTSPAKRYFDTETLTKISEMSGAYLFTVSARGCFVNNIPDAAASALQEVVFLDLVYVPLV